MEDQRGTNFYIVEFLSSTLLSGTPYAMTSLYYNLMLYASRTFLYIFDNITYSLQGKKEQYSS
jgi:hypothetical protein